MHLEKKVVAIQFSAKTWKGVAKGEILGTEKGDVGKRKKRYWRGRGKEGKKGRSPPKPGH